MPELLQACRICVISDRKNSSVLESIRLLAARLKEHSSEVEEAIYPGIGHMGIILSLARGFRGTAPLRDDIARFVARH